MPSSFNGHLKLDRECRNGSLDRFMDMPFPGIFSQGQDILNSRHSPGIIL
jgi:hypothetical protein